jgi:hypothetical protein
MVRFFLVKKYFTNEDYPFDVKYYFWYYFHKHCEKSLWWEYRIFLINFRRSEKGYSNGASWYSRNVGGKAGGSLKDFRSFSFLYNQFKF